MLKTFMQKASISEILAGVPSTETYVRQPPRPPRAPSEPASKIPTLDALDKAIEAAQINLKTCEYNRSDVLMRFDVERAKFQAELDDVNRADVHTQQRLLDLQQELRNRLEKRGYLVSVSESGELVATIPPIAIPRPHSALMPDLEDVDAPRYDEITHEDKP